MRVCMSSVTLVHPAKAVGQSEMPFGRDTLVVPRSCYRQGPQSPTGRQDLEVGTPVCSDDAACRQITLALVILLVFMTW